MYRYYNSTNKYMNREERRRNGIKSQKIVHYTDNELRNMLKRELSDLINQPYSETLKRDRYRKLEPLIDEYQKQDKKSKGTKNRSVVDIYNEERAKLPRNEVYRKLNNNYNKTTTTRTTASYQSSRNYGTRNIYGYRGEVISNYRTARAMSAYNTQINYSEATKKASKANNVRKNESVQTTRNIKNKISSPKNSTGLFDSVFSKKSRIAETKRYTNKRKNNIVSASRKSRNVRNDFERRIRYNGPIEVPHYRYFKNGREYKYEPRYL